MNTLGYVGSALVAFGSVAWTLTTVAGRFDHAFDSDQHLPAPANDDRALPEARSRRAFRIGSAVSMLLRNGLPATPVRLRCLPQEQAANAPRVPADVTPTLSFANCHYYKICCVCGEPLGQYKAFITRPLSAISRRCSEAPAHQDCAKFTAATQSRGTSIGLVMVWVTRTYEVSDGDSDVRVCIGDPEQVFWYQDGRCARRDEVRACFEAELPPLYTAAHVAGDEALLRLDMSVARATRFFPRHGFAPHLG